MENSPLNFPVHGKKSFPLLLCTDFFLRIWFFQIAFNYIQNSVYKYIFASGISTTVLWGWTKCVEKGILISVCFSSQLCITILQRFECVNYIQQIKEGKNQTSYFSRCVRLKFDVIQLRYVLESFENRLITIVTSASSNSKALFHNWYDGPFKLIWVIVANHEENREKETKKNDCYRNTWNAQEEFTCRRALKFEYKDGAKRKRKYL